eukprot:jgi/Undpi1/3601/HiC_scaffold_16.g06972.m1
MADEYKTVLTGGLSLKGGLFKSKKKKKAKRKRDEAEAEAAAVRAKEAANADDLSSGSATEDIDRDVDPRSSGSDGAGGDRNDSKDADSTSENIDDILTPAQRRFREKQLQREGKKIRNMVEKTHRERVEDFNALLASMTEHNDIPRCSAAGNG